MEDLQDRLSKWQVVALSRELHHDEAGIGKVCDLMLYAVGIQWSMDIVLFIGRRQKTLCLFLL